MSKILEKSSTHTESREMPSQEAVAHTAQTMTRSIARSFGDGLCVKELMGKIARSLGVSDRQARSLYYGEITTVPAHVYLRLVAVYRKSLSRMQARAEHDAEIYRALNQEWEAQWGNASYGSGLPSLDAALCGSCEPPSHSNTSPSP